MNHIPDQAPSTNGQATHAISQATPKVDEQYWFDFSKTFIDSSISRRDNAANALQKLVIWLWGIYTASAAVGFALSGKQLEFWPTLIIALASGALILVYWGTVWVQVPKIVAFEPRSPDDIRRVHSEIIRTRNTRLTLTLIMSVIAAIMVSVAIVVASFSKPPPSVLLSYQALLWKENGGSIVSVTAKLGTAKIAELTVKPIFNKDTMKKPTIVQNLIPAEGGLIQTSIRFEENIPKASIQLSWQEEGGTNVQLIRIVEMEKQTKPK